MPGYIYGDLYCGSIAKHWRNSNFGIDLKHVLLWLLVQIFGFQI